MKVFRAVAPRRSSVARFLSTPEEIASTMYLSSEDMVTEVFNRKPTTKYWTRFCPPGTSNNGLYVAQDPRTTFFEYSHYHLVNRDFTEGHVLSAALYELEIVNDPKAGLDITINAPPGVLDKDDPTYRAAHAFVNSLDPLPSYIRYPSVRDPKSGVCFVLYKKDLLVPNTLPVQEFQIFPDQIKNEVTFIHGEQVLLLDLSGI